MEKYKMQSHEAGIKVYNSIEDALNAPEEKIRVDLQSKRLKTLPKNFEELARIPYLELDLSYNSGLQINAIIEQLAKLKNLKGLALMRIEFKDLPESIGELTSLETLILWGNKCSSLPQSFKNLTNLRYLNLRTNGFKKIPEQLISLNKLDYLEMSYCPIKEISPKFCEAMGSTLKRLILKNCYFKRLPSEISLLQELREINLRENDLHSFPEEIGNLRNLEYLTYTGNDRLRKEHLLDILPKLQNLKKLSLYDFELNEVPDFVCQMKNLEKLNLEKNPIKTLPEGLGELKSLKEITIDSPSFAFATIWQAIENGKFKSLDTGCLPKIDTNNKSDVFFAPDLEELSLNLNDYSEIPEKLAELKKLKSLHLSHYKGESAEETTRVHEFPDFFNELVSLERVVLNSVNVTTLPPSFYSSTSIKNLRIYSCENLELDFNLLASMSQLQSLSIDIKETDLKKLYLLNNINSLTIANKTLEKLSCSLPNITSFAFDTLPALDMEDAIEKLPNLETYHSYQKISLPKNLYTLKKLKKIDVKASLTDIIDFIKLSESMEEANIVLEKSNSLKGISELNKLKSAKISYNSRISEEINIPTEFVLIDTQKIDLSHFYGKKATLAKAIASQVNDLTLDTDKQKKFAFALLMGRMEEIRDVIENPFASTQQLNSACFYIFGTPTFCTKKELEKELQVRGATVSKNLDETVTHILLTSKIKEDIGDIMKANKPFALEDDFKAQVLSEDTPYLMEEGNDEMTDQVTRLLKSEENNIELVLEIISGGGANKIILSYLMAIHLRHKDINIRKKARTLFRKYASVDLQTYIKNNWKDHFKTKNLNDTEYTSFIYHEDIDFFSYVFADKIIERNEVKNQYVTERLVIRGFRDNKLSPTFKNLDFITSILLQGNGKTFDLKSSIEYMKPMSLKQFILQNLYLDEFPIELFEHFSIEELSLDGETQSDRIRTFNIPQLPLKNSLKDLRLARIKLENVENLQTVCSNLTYLSLYDTGLRTFPSFIKKCSKLTNLSVSKSEIKRIDFDFSQLPQLQYLSISECPLESIEDTFQNNTHLTSIVINKTEMEVVPFSFFTLNNHNLSLHLNNNRIHKIKQPISSIFAANTYTPFSTISLENNELTEIPAFFKELRIGVLNLKENPIKDIPKDIHKYKIGQLSLYKTQINSVPIELFYSTASIDIYNAYEKIELPPIEEIPTYKNYKSISFAQQSQEDKELLEIIRKKQSK